MSSITISTLPATASRERSATQPSVLAVLKATVQALGDGLSAYHRYERNRSRGMSDVAAARAAFDLDRRA